MDYGSYINISREELLELLSEKLKKQRYDHVLRVEETGLLLAEQYEESKEKTSIACLLHDLMKEADDEKSREIIITENLPLNLLNFGNPIWHGPLSAVYAHKNLGVEDTDILNAVRNHTLGTEHMSLLEKIVFVADYIEPGRNFDGVEQARDLAQKNLDACIGYASKKTLEHLLQKNKKVHPQTVMTYNKYFVEREGVKDE